jgi:hypothetical protein
MIFIAVTKQHCSHMWSGGGDGLGCHGGGSIHTDMHLLALYIQMCACISVGISMQHTSSMQSRLLCVSCAFAARLLRVCYVVAARSPPWHVAFRVAALSLRVRRAGRTSCACIGRLLISFRSAPLDWIATAGSNRRAVCIQIGTLVTV